MYTLFGFNEFCEDFEWKFDSFVAAVKRGREWDMCLSVVFLKRETVGTCKHVRL